MLLNARYVSIEAYTDYLFKYAYVYVNDFSYFGR